MPSTSVLHGDGTDWTAAIRTLGDRTDGTGTAVTDLKPDEDRLANHVLTEGFLTSGAFQPADGSTGMEVDVGSGTAKADIYVVEGDDDGQHPYLVRMDDVTVTVTLDAGDADDRIDEIYLVVRDKSYDAGTLSLPQIAVRKGDAAASPTAPGPDSDWDAFVLLATINVGAAASTVAAGDITDERAAAALIDTLQDSFTGSLVVKNSAEAASFDTGGAGAWEDALTVDLTVPSNWTGWDIDVLTTFEHIGADNLDWRIVIDGVTQNQISNVAQGLYSLGARDTGSSTGTVTVKFQVRDAGSGSNRLIDLYLFARADRTG